MIKKGKEIKQLLKKNNKREEKILKENDGIYTDMIVYLRGADINEYNQELVREDLIEMILNGQERGDDIQKVIGDNYKEICDEIIETIPKRTKKEKILGAFNLSLSIVWILGGVSILKTIINCLLIKSSEWNFILSIGDLINMLFIIIMSNFVVNYVCKKVFDNSKKNKYVLFIKNWIICMVIFGGMFAISYYLSYPILNISLFFAIVIVGIFFVLDKIISQYVI